MSKFDIDEPYELEKFVPFLKKADVVEGCDIEIINVHKPRKQKRLLFHAVFIDKVCKFDLTDGEVLKIIDRFGNVPREWIGKRIRIKAVDYYNEITKRSGYQLKIGFFDD